jgi:hypothetical protein
MKFHSIIVLACAVAPSVVAMEIQPVCSIVQLTAEEAFKSSDYKQASILYKAFADSDRQLEVRAHINYAESLLARGNFEKGFQAFDARLENTALPRKPLQKPWDGNPEIQGKTILVRGEHGIGDTFLFAGFLGALHHAGAHVVVRERAFLKSILSRCGRFPDYDHISRIITSDEEEKTLRYHHDVYMMSLPRYVSNAGIVPTKTAGDIMPCGAYLHPRPELVEYWKKEMRNDTKFKILIAAYRASTNVAGECRHLERDCPINDLVQALNIPGVSLYCAPGDHTPISGSEYRQRQMDRTMGTLDVLDVVSDAQRGLLHTFDGTFDKKNGAFEDTAAVMKVVDYVVSVDTAAGQLARALKLKHFGLLLPKESDWRWGEGQSCKSPFFPNAGLFWQEIQEDWSAPLAKLHRAVIIAMKKKHKQIKPYTHVIDDASPRTGQKSEVHT